MLAGPPVDIFDDLLARTFAWSSFLSHLSPLNGFDESKTLSYQIQLLGPTGADVRQHPVSLARGQNAVRGRIGKWKGRPSLLSFTKDSLRQCGHAGVTLTNGARLAALRVVADPKALWQNHQS
jgi:hypothetical protein